jgi:hypothetical protein
MDTNRPNPLSQKGDWTMKNEVEIYCLMHSGISLSEAAREVLLENAQWMRFERSCKWKIKHPCCEGYIESNLQPIGYMGFEAIKFHALIDTPDGTTTVDYMVRTSDLDNVCLSKMAWAKRVKIPKHIREAAIRAIAEHMAREGFSEEDYEIGEGIGVRIEGDLGGPVSLFVSEDENEEKRHPFSDN